MVRGEPDVGKSALALAAMDAIRKSGGTVVAVSLRDLPGMALALKEALGLAPETLFAAAPSAPTSVLLLDGVEVIQERECGSFGALIGAAVEARLKTILVVRDDGAEAVLDILRTRGVEKPAEFSVGPLSAPEIALLVKAVPDLACLAADSRSAWLLRRIGLVELLLRAAQGGSCLPEVLTSEAEVFATVWNSLIRVDERIANGVSPDDREAAAVEIARQLLMGGISQIVGGSALSSLRSDGVLVSYGRSAAWSTGDCFTSDVLRDFAAARFLLRSPPGTLHQSPGPRWAIRASRLFVQARLSQAVSSTLPITDQWRQFRSEFNAMAAEHGPRWAEIPWEAILTAGWAPRAFSDLTDAFLADPDLPAEAMRTVKLRFSREGALDPDVAHPLVAWLINNGKLAQRHPRVEDPVRETVLLWLRGVARLESSGEDISRFRSLRAQVADILADGPLERGDGERLESLGLLGSDTSDQANTLLRSFAESAPGFLAPLVERLDVANVMSRNDSALLAELAERYYIEEPSRHPWGVSPSDKGIRGHEGGGMDAPLAAWYRGPFLPLLRTDFQRALQLINRMLDRGASTKNEVLRRLTSMAGGADNDMDGLELQVLDANRSKFIGDSKVWSWYRGSSVGPYPCMSALLSLELFMDGCVQSGLKPGAIAKRVFRDATTLASAGLCFGFLVRHIDRITAELDDFLAVPLVWQLEFARATAENANLHVQGADPPGTPGTDRRTWTPHQIAMYLVSRAMRAGNNERLARLKEIGLQLIESAGGASAHAAVLRSAAHLDWNNYVTKSHGDAQFVTVEVPDHVTEALAPIATHVDQQGTMYRLLSRYQPRPATPYRWVLAELPSDEDLKQDVADARNLQDALGEDDAVPLSRALAGVAAAIIRRASVSGANELSPESLVWSLSLLILCASSPRQGMFNQTYAYNPGGADRIAALALPWVLIGPDGDSSSPSDGGEVVQLLDSLEAAISAGMSSLSPELRVSAAEGLRILFDQRCSPVTNRPCWHEVLWKAIDSACRTVLLGPWEEGRRHVQPITVDIRKSLAQAADDDLMLDLIAPTMGSVIDIASRPSCISDRARELREPLVSAWARAASHWAERNYHRRPEHDAALAAAFLRWAEREGSQVIIELAERLGTSIDPISNYLDSLIIVATHETEYVSVLTDAWPRLMELGFKTLRSDGYRMGIRDEERLVSHLVPAPSVFGCSDDSGAAIEKARSHWFPLQAVSSHITEWLAVAEGRMFAVDSLVGFLQTLPIRDQLQSGLDWVRTLLVNDDGTASTSGFLLVGWLGTMREPAAVEESARRTYRTIVDALVLSNFKGARALQRLDE